MCRGRVAKCRPHVADVSRTCHGVSRGCRATSSQQHVTSAQRRFVKNWLGWGVRFVFAFHENHERTHFRRWSRFAGVSQAFHEGFTSFTTGCRVVNPCGVLAALRGLLCCCGPVSACLRCRTSQAHVIHAAVGKPMLKRLVCKCEGATYDDICEAIQSHREGNSIATLIIERARAAATPESAEEDADAPRTDPA